MHPGVIETAEQATPAWVSAALQLGGYDVEVRDVVWTPVGTGQMAASFRLNLTYSSGDGPASVVAKLPATDEVSRASGAAGGYVTEVIFYEEIAETVAIRVPQCFYAARSDDDTLFSLLLEDLAPGVQGDQIAGCSVEQARAAVVNLAGLHGPRWCDESVRNYGNSYSEPAAVEFIGALMRDDIETFIGRYEARLSAEEIIILRRHAETIGTWLQTRTECFGLVHGDYRLDNLLFATDAGGYPCATVDWQTLSHGNPLRDLGYFLGNGLDPDDRRASERDLVETYHTALRGYGVHDYPLDQCWDDYRLGQFQGPMVTVLGAVHAVRTDRGDEMFMAMAHRSCAAVKDLNSFDLL